MIVRDVDFVTLPSVAVRLALVWLVTLMCLKVNVAVLAPAGTLTVDGIVAAGLELVRLIVRPPVGAGPVSETVPVTTVVALPFTVEGETVIEVSATGSTVRVACTD